jgi:hypothetical protein
MRAIVRDDGELCGYVAAHQDRWRAVSVFGGLLAEAGTAQDAERVVLETGLAALAERWLLVTAEDPDGEIVCIVEASPDEVTLALGYYSFEGAPTRRVPRAEIAGGLVEIRRLG